MLHDDHRGVEIQQWYNVWRMEPSWNAYFERLEQLEFVRDLKYIFPQGSGIDIQVVSTHNSKGVKLPVYSVYFTKGYWPPRGSNGEGTGTCRVQLRNNFYDWKISVFSPWNGKTDLREDFLNLWDYDQQHLQSCYFEGFQDKHVLKSLENATDYDGYSFSASLPTSNFCVWTFMWLLNRHIELGKDQ